MASLEQSIREDRVQHLLDTLERWRQAGCWLPFIERPPFWEWGDWRRGHRRVCIIFKACGFRLTRSVYIRMAMEPDPRPEEMGREAMIRFLGRGLYGHRWKPSVGASPLVPSARIEREDGA